MASNKDKCRRMFQDVWNAGKVEYMQELLAEDYQGTIPLVGQVDLASFRATVGAFRRAFPDLRFEVRDLIAEGDKVAIRWTATGTSKGEFMGMPASNRRTTVNGFTLSEFKGGKIANDHTEYDEVSFLHSLGVKLPELEGAGAEP